MKKILLITLLLILTNSVCYGVTVAVFPLDDLSKEKNSINIKLTHYFSEYLDSKGLETIEGQKVISFMGEKRIRSLGYLETENILAARQILKTDFILLGSVCQNRDDIAAIGINLSLIRTIDARTVWANVGGLSVDDNQRILGLKSPKNTDELLTVLTETIFSDLPIDRDYNPDKELAGLLQKVVTNSTHVEIESVLFSPKYVRPGQKIKCTVKFRSSFDKERNPRIYLKVNNRVHIAQTTDGLFYEASWDTPERELIVKNINNVQFAAKGFAPSMYEEVWNSDYYDAKYPVSMVVDWPSGAREENFLGTFVVDSQPPQFSLNPKSKDINGVQFFREELPIYIKWQNKESVEKWEVTIRNDKGESVLTSKGRKMPEQLIWHGQNSKNHKVVNGNYRITLKVWDKAGNVGSAISEVVYHSKVAGVNLNIKKEHGHLLVDILHEGRVPPSYWRAEIWTKDNNLIKLAEGNSLPANFSMDLSQIQLEQVDVNGILVVKDSLGNKMREQYEDLINLAALADAVLPSGDNNIDTSINTSNSESTWHEEF